MPQRYSRKKNSDLYNFDDGWARYWL